MIFLELLHVLEADLETTFVSDGFGRVVGVAAISVPVTLDWLGSVGDIASEIFSNLYP